MRAISIGLIACALIVGIISTARASDWDKAGKILTGIEGVRIITGGNVDLIGTITGINRGKSERQGSQESRVVRRNDPRGCHRQPECAARYYRHSCAREWVAHLVWKEKYIPGHEEYRAEYGRVVFVEGHYVKYQVGEGGHWVYRCNCAQHRHGELACSR